MRSRRSIFMRKMQWIGRGGGAHIVITPEVSADFDRAALVMVSLGGTGTMPRGNSPQGHRLSSTTRLFAPAGAALAQSIGSLA